MDTAEVVAQILQAAQWTAARSSGPGGQRRDKVSTRAELTIPAEAVAGLPEDVARLVSRALGLDVRPLRISVQEERLLGRNQEIASERLAALIDAALAPPPPPRVATRPSRAATARRVDEKARRGGVKRLRRPPDDVP